MAIAFGASRRGPTSGWCASNNQDSGYAGPHLLVIADGMGGHAGGDNRRPRWRSASWLRSTTSRTAPTPSGHLSAAVYAAHRELLGGWRGTSADRNGYHRHRPARTGARFALAHIGDSRAYLLRKGSWVQITRDHTFVQRLVDDGKLTLEEAEQAPPALGAHASAQRRRRGRRAGPLDARGADR